MAKRVLITGGAGFIGSHLADELLARGYDVRALDNLSPQVHGAGAVRPEYLSPDVELVVGDVRDPGAVESALKGVDAVYHFAAAVGVGQSMYEMEMYTDVNCRGTGVLLEALVKKNIERLVVASSMSVYGEGYYASEDGSVTGTVSRSMEDLKAGRWELRDETGKRQLRPVPTTEDKPPSISSIYALSKYYQERACMMAGQAYGIPSVALRFFNAFGTRQSFSNPYTGVLAIFAARLLGGKPPLIYEDGLQRRDFVSVRDIAAACRLALESAEAPGRVFNVGSGRSSTILEVSEKMAEALGCGISGRVEGKYRVGDIRHCFADISAARRYLGYEPKVPLEEGISELAEYIAGQTLEYTVPDAAAELESRGLTI